MFPVSGADRRIDRRYSKPIIAVRLIRSSKQRLPVATVLYLTNLDSPFCPGCSEIPLNTIFAPIDQTMDLSSSITQTDLRQFGWGSEGCGLLFSVSYGWDFREISEM